MKEKAYYKHTLNKNSNALGLVTSPSTTEFFIFIKVKSRCDRHTTISNLNMRVFLLIVLLPPHPPHFCSRSA